MKDEAKEIVLVTTTHTQMRDIRGQQRMGLMLLAPNLCESSCGVVPFYPFEQNICNPCQQQKGGLKFSTQLLPD